MIDKVCLAQDLLGSPLTDTDFRKLEAAGRKITESDVAGTNGDQMVLRGEELERRGIPAQSAATLQHSGCTMEQYAQHKRLPPEFLKNIGLKSQTYMGAPAIRIAYWDQQGTERAVQFCLALDPVQFRWKKGSKTLLYGLWLLARAYAAGYVVLVESIADCHTLWLHGFPALAIPLDSWKESRDAHHLQEIPRIYVLRKSDPNGFGIETWLLGSSIRDRVQLVSLGDYVDANALYIAEPDHFRDYWLAAIDEAVPWLDPEAAGSTARQAQLQARREDLWKRCRELAEMPSVLDRVVEALGHAGVVGEKRAIKLLFLIINTRFLQRPVSVKVAGPSAAGKSYVVEQVLRFCPTNAYYALSAMSEHALAYLEEPLAHRFLVLYEAVPLESGFAAYLVRSLLSEGRVRYETVEKGEDGLFHARLIEREGPTGLITTTTAVHLHPENETRIFTIPVDDSPEQTKRVMVAAAAGPSEEVDLTPWHVLQEWLATAEHRVTIPFGQELARKIPASGVRLRRDFQAVLSLIRSHAILHQANRQLDGDGRIIATLDDYRAVRDLVADLLADALERTVSPTTQQTVDAVKRLAATTSEVSVTQLAKELNLDKSPTSRRVRVALDRGYLQNLDTQKGKPFKLVLGEPLPTDAEVLPAPEALDGEGCSVAAEIGGLCASPASNPQHEGEREVFYV